MKIQVIYLNSEDGGVLERTPLDLEVPTPCTVHRALAILGHSSAELEQLLAQRAVAVFGLYATPDTQLEAGDRLEILDMLRFDPKESRRRRAAHKQATATARPGRRSGRQSKT
ncbi:MAG TPA: RnfH family protein [Limnobacter sp.]|nr:RnfH family protein [Limnobacter sp.]